MVGVFLGLASAATHVWQRTQLPTAEELRDEDPRDPVTYLRSFNQDINERDRFRVADLPGPVITITQPGLRLKPFGAARLDGGPNWQERVLKLIGESYAVIFQCTGTSESSGYWWEQQQIIPGLRSSPSRNDRALVEPANLIGMIEGGKKGERSYSDWASMVQPALAGLLPPVELLPGTRGSKWLSHLRAWVMFTDDWTPCVVPAEDSDRCHPPLTSLLLPAARKPLEHLAHTQQDLLHRRADLSDPDVTTELEAACAGFDRQLLDVQIAEADALSRTDDFGDAVQATNFAWWTLDVASRRFADDNDLIRRAEDAIHAAEAAVERALAAPDNEVTESPRERAVLEVLSNSDARTDEMPVGWSISDRQRRNVRTRGNIRGAEKVLAIIDLTALGSAKDALAITEQGLYYNMNGTSEFITYDELKTLPIAPKRGGVTVGSLTISLVGSTMSKRKVIALLEALQTV